MEQFKITSWSDFSERQISAIEGRVPWYVSWSQHRYQKEYFGKNVLQDFGGLITKDNNAIALMPLVLLEKGGEKNLCSYSSNIIAPFLLGGGEKIQKTLAEGFNEYLGRLKAELKLNNLSVEFYCDDNSLSVFEYNFSKNIASSKIRQHFTADSSGFKFRYSKSVKADLKKAKEALTGYVVNAKNLNNLSSGYRGYRDLHFELAGKTKSDLAWDIKRSAIESGEAILSVALWDGQLVGASYLLLGASDAYYLSGAYRKELRSLNISHYCLDAAFSFLQAQGDYSVYLSEIPESKTDLSEKESDILLFKSRMANNVKAHRVYTI